MKKEDGKKKPSPKTKAFTIVVQQESVNMNLRVPVGLLDFLEKVEDLTGEKPIDHLEATLARELEAMVSSLPGSFFDLDLIRTRYGEGSEVDKPNREQLQAVRLDICQVAK